MWVIHGFWYDGKHSGQYPATVSVNTEGEVIVRGQEDNAELYRGQFDGLKITSRLGNSTRFVYFPDQQKFETRDNDQLDQVDQHFANNGFWSWIHRFETRWHYVLLALVAFIGFSAFVVKYGVPAAADIVAHALPDWVYEKAGEQTMKSLDDYYLEPSQLPETVKHRITTHFQPLVDLHPHLNLRLLFRDGGPLGANAFALPDGTIVFTDQMVDLSLNDDELLSVMAHEIGHVEHRHGMRGVVQGSLLGFMLLLLTGDATGVAEALLGIPILLTELGYSRHFEHEADDYAYDYMVEHNIETAHFANLMLRLQRSVSCGGQRTETAGGGIGKQGSTKADTPDKPSDAADCGPDSHVLEKYLSTHPMVEERIERFSRPSGQ